MKRVLALLLVAVFAVMCFSGCADDGNMFVIGATGPLTGDEMSYGVSVNQGANIAVDEINAAGGLNGNKFKFIMKDDKATARGAASAYDSLCDEGMQVSIGSVTSGSCEVFADKASADRVFVLTPTASSASVIEKGDNIFCACFDNTDQGVLAAEELTKTYKNIGCIYDADDTYSTGIWKAFDAKMKELGVAYALHTFNADNKKDFSAQVDALKQCDVIFLPIYYAEAGLIAKSCSAKGINAALFGCDGLDGVAGQVDVTVKNKISYIAPFDINSTQDTVVSFVSKYKEKYGVEPDQFAVNSYDAVYAIYSAMKAANVKDVKIPASDLCDILIKTFRSPAFSYKGVTGEMTWQKNGACNKKLIIVDA